MLNHGSIYIEVIALVDFCFAIVLDDFILAVTSADSLPCHIAFV